MNDRPGIGTFMVVALLLEPVALWLAGILITAGLFRLPWRDWIDTPTAHVSLPFAALLVVTLLVHQRLHARYALPPEAAMSTPRLKWAGALFFSCVTALLIVVFAIATTRFSSSESFSLIEPQALVASLLPILTIAVFEEVLYRRVLMSRLLRVGLPMLLALAAQALVFTLMHGPGARHDLRLFCWFFVGGLTLGTLYLATRSLWAPVAFHAGVDLAFAQVGPHSHWFTQRAIEDIAPGWNTPLIPLWLFAVVAYWAWRMRATTPARTGSPPVDVMQLPPASTIAPHGRHPRLRGDFRDRRATPAPLDPRTPR